MGFRADYARRRLQVRCLFHHGDPVVDVMTLAKAFVLVDPGAPVAQALDIARANWVKHLLVAERDRIVGTVCLCELIAGRGSGLVDERMTPAPWALPREATIADAARLMRTEETDIVLIHEGRVVVGLVTDGDLHRMGVPASVLERRACLACRTTVNVCRHPRNSGMDFCLDCLEKSVTADNENGVAD